MKKTSTLCQLYSESISLRLHKGIILTSVHTYVDYDKNNTVILTTALYFLAILLASVDFPDRGGPTTHTLQGLMGLGGIRNCLGLCKNCFSASAVDMLYILSRNLHRKQSKKRCCQTILHVYYNK